MGQQGSISEPAPSFADVCGALEAGERVTSSESLDSNLPKIPDKFQRLALLGHLEVDAEIARGIFLRESLRQGGRLWLTCPAKLDEKSCAALWNRSRPVKRFDVFLSHAWMTAGRWKLLSLLMQSGSHQVLFVWVLGVGAAAALSLLGLLPSPWTFQARVDGLDVSIPFGPWILLASFLATFLGLVSAPYFPSTRRQSDICFVDVASIHQSDKDLMERGIYGIGGFLSISSELRVLWSAPYLSRLWCVFELAAFRTANPSGKITLSPLFVEMIVVMILLMQYFYLGIWWSLRTLRSEVCFDLSHALGVLPSFVVLHVLRKVHVVKHTLFSKLESFDISEAQCTSDFDKNFIRTAIVQWYGSEGAFTDFVRGPLRKELAASAHCCTFFDYELLLLSPVAASVLTVICGSWLGGLPHPAIAVQVVSTISLGLVWGRLSIKLSLCLCDRFAQPRWSDARDYLQTLLVFLIFAAFVFAATVLSRAAKSCSLKASLAFLLFGLLSSCLSSRLARMSWRL
mmetsp:Transcript_53653/g.128317  ORF Transcript_53653/g.128317 Transcript_53653/m.128317 type:complete len:514 (-) Transcript_53653:34-1575(-)